MLAAIHAGPEHPEDAIPPLDEAIGSFTISLPPTLREIPRCSSGSALAVYPSTERWDDVPRPLARRLTYWPTAGATQSGWEQERGDCVLMAADVIARLPRPAYTAQALRLAVDLSSTCREWLPRGDIGEHLLAAAAVVLSGRLTEAGSGGVSPDEWPAAALEVSAGVQSLADQRSGVLRAEHVQALAQAAAALAAVSQLEEALDLNTRAIELYQNLAAGENEMDPLLGVASLVQQGVFLTGKQRHEDAIRPLEQAFPSS